MRLPKVEQKQEKWQVAIECLIMAAEGRGPSDCNGGHSKNRHSQKPRRSIRARQWAASFYQSWERISRHDTDQDRRMLDDPDGLIAPFWLSDVGVPGWLAFVR